MGWKWYHNQSQEKLIKDGDAIPDGFERGRAPFCSETRDKIRAARSGRPHIVKDGVEKIISPEELDYYLEQGWVRGRAEFSAEANENIRRARKEFFENNPNWTNPTSWKPGRKTWNKGIPMKLEARIKLSNARLGTHLSEEMRLQRNRKEYITKKKNGTFNTSKPEEEFYALLLTLFDKEDIVRGYNDANRYPFNCDFYIKSKDLFIECNFHWTHGTHPFNPNDLKDVSDLEKLKESCSRSRYYESAVTVWSVKDPFKLETAVKNNINYVVIYNKEDIDDIISRIQGTCKDQRIFTK